MALLLSYPWPGIFANCKMLSNVPSSYAKQRISRWMRVGFRSVLASEPSGHLKLTHKLAAHEKEMIEAALCKSEGRVSGPSGAATKLGISRSTLRIEDSVTEDQQIPVLRLQEPRNIVTERSSLSRVRHTLQLRQYEAFPCCSRAVAGPSEMRRAECDELWSAPVFAACQSDPSSPVSSVRNDSSGCGLLWVVNPICRRAPPATQR